MHTNGSIISEHQVFHFLRVRNNASVWNNDFQGNVSNETNPFTGALDTSPDIVGLFFMSTIMVCTIIGNAAVCWIIHKNSSLQTVPNRFVLNLAWCDLLTALINGPFTLVALSYNRWVMGHVLCQINGFLTTLFGLASVLTLAVISLNRCCLIVYSSTCYVIFTDRNTSLMIAGVWLLTVVCAFPPVIGWSSYSFIPGKAICTLMWSTDVAYTLVVLILGVAAPFIVMIVSYYKIFAKVRDSNRKIGSQRSKARGISTVMPSSAKPMDSGAPPPLGQNPTLSSLQQSSSQPSKGSRASKASTENTVLDRCFTASPSSFAAHKAKSHQGIMRTESSISVDSKKTLRFLCDKYGRLHTAEPFSNERKVLTRRRLSLESPPHAAAPGTEPNNRTVIRRLSLDSPRSSAHPTANLKMARAERLDGFSPGASSCGSLDTVAMGHTSSWRSLSHGNTVASSVRNASLSYLIGADPVSTSARNTGASNALEQSPKKNAWNDDMKVTLTLLVVIFVFMLSWAPISIVNCLETFLGYQIPRFLDRLTVYMVFLQSAVNPIIYGLMNRNFREGFRSIFCCMMGSNVPARQVTVC